MSRRSIKQRLSSNLVSLLDRFSSGLKKYNSFGVDGDVDSEYQVLTPSLEADSNGTYSEALKSAITRSDCFNIGITGPFGSGKSSILKAFEEKHKNEFNFLTISLATFSKFDKLLGATNEDLSIVEKSKIRQNLEISILQQVLYREKPSLLPDSRFSRIRKSRGYKLLFWTPFILLWIHSFIFLLEPSFLKETTIWSFLDWQNSKFQITFVSWLIFILGLFVLIYNIIKNYRGFKLSKLNLAKGEISLNKIDQLSILNKHLDELVYFFEKTNYNIVQIEDLDRFDDEAIFTNLREINYLLNNSAQIDRKIVFIYAIRDDLFKEGQQTKFFDFIVPVIPIVNTSNSGDKLYDWFSKKGLTNRISSSFLHDLSLFISDMRLAKNIFNEFLIYDREIGSKLDKEKLLGIVIFKNLFPEDFSKLHSGQSLINDILDAKGNFKATLAAKLEGETFKLNEEIGLKKAEIKIIRNELTAEYGEKLRAYLDDPAIIYFTNEEFVMDEDSALFEAFLKNDITHLQVEDEKIEKTLTLVQFESKHNRVFSEDFELKTKRVVNEIDRMQVSVNINEKNVSELSSWKLGDMLRYDIDLFYSCLPSEIKMESALEYLLINEYVDENYINYISFYHEGTITQGEKSFLVNVKNYGDTNYDEEIIHPLEVISKIELFEFRRAQALNVTIVDFLLNNRSEYAEQIKWVIRQSLNRGTGFKEFFKVYINQGNELRGFFTELARTWKNLWRYVVQESDFEKNEIKSLFIRLLENLSIKDLQSLDVDGELAQFILSENLFSEYPETINNKLTSLIEALDMKLDKLDEPIENEKLFESIVSKDLYTVSYSSIRSILEYHLKDDFDQGEFDSSNYTYILEKSISELTSYVQDAMNTYVNQVYLELSSDQTESHDAMIDLVCDPSLSKDLKIEIINKFESKFETCEDIDDELIPFIYSTNKVVATWKNVSLYYEFFESIDEYLIDFYHHSSSELSSMMFNTKGDNTTTIRREIILSKNINLESYVNLLKSNPFTYSDLSLNEISTDKVEVLIDRGKISMTDFYFKLIREHHSELTIKLFEKNQDTLNTFIDDPEYRFKPSEVVEILLSDRIPKDLQYKSIKSRIHMTSTYGSYFSNSICRFLQKSDSIFDLTKHNLSSLLKKSEDYDSKIVVLKLSLEKFPFDEDFVRQSIKAVGHPLSKVNIRKGWFEIDNNPDLLAIMAELDSNNYISSYSLKKSGKRIRITRKGK